MTNRQPDQLFVSTAPYYARYRPGYDPAMYAFLTERFHLDGSQRVLDLGTGTGTIALAIAPHVHEVIAVDPEPGMLAEGRALAAERNITNITWAVGDSTTLPGMPIGAVLLATMGAAFHWTDRHQTLRDFDTIVEPRGAVALVSGGAPGDLEPAAWLDVIAAIRTRYLGPDRRAGTGTYQHPTERHQDVLAQSVFNTIETRTWDRTITRTIDDVIGLQFSYSYSSPAQLGPDKDAFEADLRNALLDYDNAGRYDELVRTEVIIGTRT